MLFYASILFSPHSSIYLYHLSPTFPSRSILYSRLSCSWSWKMALQSSSTKSLILCLLVGSVTGSFQVEDQRRLRPEYLFLQLPLCKVSLFLSTPTSLTSYFGVLLSQLSRKLNFPPMLVSLCRASFCIIKEHGKNTEHFGLAIILPHMSVHVCLSVFVFFFKKQLNHSLKIMKVTHSPKPVKQCKIYKEINVFPQCFWSLSFHLITHLHPALPPDKECKQTGQSFSTCVTMIFKSTPNIYTHIWRG